MAGAMAFADILTCETVNVDGRCYRVQSAATCAADAAPRPFKRGAPGRQAHDLDDEDYADDASIVANANGKGFHTCISADQELFGFIIGKQGSAKRKIEEDTGAQIHIPRKDEAKRNSNKPQEKGTRGGGKGSESNSEITVKADTRGQVAAARTRIELALESALGSPHLPYTHFLSLPLATPTVVAALTDLKATVLANGGEGIEESIFWDARQLHLTLGMLKLYSAQRREAARKTLKALDLRTVLGGEPLQVRLRGLEYMNDDPSEVDVLYLKVEVPDQRLTKLCDHVIEKFTSAGLLLPQDEKPVKLHATVMNTRLRAGDGPRQGFDARKVLEVHGSDLDVGTVDLSAIHLSQRGVFDEGGYYHCVVKADM